MSEHSEALEINSEPVEQHIEQHTEHDQKQFLNSLSDDFDPSDAVEQAHTEKSHSELEPAFDMDAARGTILFAMMGIEATMKAMVHPDFKFNPDYMEQFIEFTAPCVLKHGGEMPEWMKPYKEELMAAFAVGALSVSCVFQIRELRRRDAEIEVNKNESDKRKQQAE